jgi:hypothetical protein
VAIDKPSILLGFGLDRGVQKSEVMGTGGGGALIQEKGDFICELIELPDDFGNSIRWI